MPELHPRPSPDQPQRPPRLRHQQLQPQVQNLLQPQGREQEGE